jgi:hypothetical protein
MKGWVAIGAFVVGAMVCPAEVTVRDVTHALIRMETRKPTDWAYTQSVFAEKFESVARHDPRLPHAIRGWTLLRMNGREPSEKEARTFHEKIAEQAEKAEEAGDTAPVLTELIRMDTLQPLRVDASGQAVFGFVPQIDKLEDILTGELDMNEEQQRITAIRVWNRGDYSPAFSVKVTGFVLDLDFGAQGSDMVLTQMVSKVKGTVGFLKKVDQTLRVAFSEYELLEGEEDRPTTGPESGRSM